MTIAAFRLVLGVAMAALFSALFPAELRAQRVAIVAADIGVEVADVRAKLVAAGLIDVTVVPVASVRGAPALPTLTELQQFDAILTWSNYDYLSADILGNRLADYVDQGGGVVQAVFSFADTGSGRLNGRWLAEAYSPFTPGSFSTGFRLTHVATIPAHPILSGVSTFNGGSSSYHQTVGPQGCAQVIARWSNGRPLVAARVGPHGGRVVGLNFYPASSGALNPGYWDSSTDGAILMANALRFATTPADVPEGPSVALLAADDPLRATDVKCKLQNTQLFSRVDLIDARLASTPSLAALLGYDAVLTWSNAPYGDSTTLGNVLADYVDSNRGVVHSAVSLSGSPAGRLAGRWQTEGYRPLTEAAVIGSPSQTLVADDPGHVLLAGVSTFSGGAASYHASPVAMDAASTQVASWSDGAPLLVFGTKPSGGRLVGLNMYPPSSESRADLWDRTTDGARLIANTLLFAANHFPSVELGANQAGEAESGAGITFQLSAAASDIDGDVLAFVWPGAPAVAGGSVDVDVPPPPAPQKTHTVTVTVRVSDGRGGEATDSVDLTVTDTVAPVLHNMPSGDLAAEATSAAGATVQYGPVTAADAVDGDVAVVCSHSGVFPIGDTLVTCSSSDSRDNVTTATFTVRVTDVSQPGEIAGAGSVVVRNERYGFAFRVSETASGGERGRLYLRGTRLRFAATSVDFVRFDGKTVVFRGTGSLNGAAGYRFEVAAGDRGAGHGHPDAISISVLASDGRIVARIEGPLKTGGIRTRKRTR